MTYVLLSQLCKIAESIVFRTCKIIKRSGMILTLLVFSNASADSLIEPSEAEWNAWPEFCKAGYLAGSYSQGSRFTGRMPASKIEQLRANYAQTVGIPGAQHFCFGMAFLDRAKYAGGKAETKKYLDRAFDELNYSYSRIKESAPKYSLFTSYYGTALYLAGKRRQAFEMWNRGIRIQPASRESYLAMAKTLLDEEKPKEALEVLLRYDQSKEYESPDAEYFLGFTYFQVGMHDKAQEHAEKAYRLGYPSLWLQEKLKNLGK